MDENISEKLFGKEARAMIERKRITENIYNAVKMILKGGATAQETADAMGISTNSVYRINKCGTYAEYVNLAYMNGSARYREATKEETEQKAEQKAEQIAEPMKQQGGTLSAGYQMNRIYEALKEQNEILRLLSNKVAFIVDELTK